MLTIEKWPDGILHIVADGQLTTEEYADFVPLFERLSDRPRPLLIELGPGFTGWTLDALWRDLKFDVEHRKQFGRIAVVGNKEWEKWGTEASAPFFPAEMRFFEAAERLQAEQWLQQALYEGEAR